MDAGVFMNIKLLRKTSCKNHLRTECSKGILLKIKIEKWNIKTLMNFKFESYIQ